MFFCYSSNNYLICGLLWINLLFAFTCVCLCTCLCACASGCCGSGIGFHLTARDICVCLRACVCAGMVDTKIWWEVGFKNRLDWWVVDSKMVGGWFHNRQEMGS